MIRAALFTPNLTLGGAERWVVSLVKYADPKQLRWTGVAVSGWGGAERSLCAEIADRVPLHTNPVAQQHRKHRRPFDYSCFAGIHATLPAAVAAAAQDAQVVVGWGGPDLTTWLPRLKVPVVLTSHTTETNSHSTPVRGATHLAAVSQAAARFFEGRHEGLPVSVLYNGAEVDRCQAQQPRSAMRQLWGFSDTDVVVGYIGRQAREKNPRAAIEAVAELPQQFKAVYYGEPVSRPGDADLNLPGYAEERAAGRVTFRPPQRQVGDVLGALDVCMLASHREAFSLALIEAWISGTPVVATPVGALPELEHKHGSLVVRVPINPTAEELAEAVCCAAGPEGREIASKARNLALKRFTCEHMLQRWTKYLKTVCR
jgi:glycosyltransferase involved in cell wall biosynthesis